MSVYGQLVQVSIKRGLIKGKKYIETGTRYLQLVNGLYCSRTNNPSYKCENKPTTLSFDIACDTDCDI